jgi:UDP-xylose/UDP-N-acetylglucosamine transporter B4
LPIYIPIYFRFFRLPRTSSVFSVVSTLGSLTLTLVITLRKFLSVGVSVVLFGNRFTGLHAAGAGLVMVGTFVYASVKGSQADAGKKEKKS